MYMLSCFQVRHFFADVVSNTSKSNDDGLVPEKLKAPFRRGKC